MVGGGGAGGKAWKGVVGVALSTAPSSFVPALEVLYISAWCKYKIG